MSDPAHIRERRNTSPGTIGSLTASQRTLLGRGDRPFARTSMRELRTYRVLQRLGLIKAIDREWTITPRGLTALATHH